MSYSSRGWRFQHDMDRGVSGGEGGSSLIRKVYTYVIESMYVIELVLHVLSTRFLLYINRALRPAFLQNTSK